MEYPSMMDVSKMVAALHEELSGVKLAIEALEAIAGGREKRRGRPPKSESAFGSVVIKRRGRPPGSKNKKPPAEPAT